MIERGKKGLSPVIATVLLIGLALILAMIVFFWARGFIAEKIDKFGRDIALSCEEVNIRVEANVQTSGGLLLIDITNEGTIPIYGAYVLVKDPTAGELIDIANSPFARSISGGDVGSMTVSVRPGVQVINKEILVVPKLLGTNNDERQEFTCDQKFGVPAIVGSI